MDSGLRHVASKNRSAAGFDHISRVSVAFPKGEGYGYERTAIDEQSLPSVGKVASEASRIGF